LIARPTNDAKGETVIVDGVDGSGTPGARE
jgi:hypothetical protein